ncbi:extensin [Contarinia nasturtii]|uniref:extensin n=1 Tax=Contarinia nasturtii TaxID=265458 RepID=UPI0012D4A00A|nr:extensin [Contarinia nasturtii]
MYNISRIIVMLCTVSAAMCTTLPTDTLAASIDEVQKKFSAGGTAEKRIINANARMTEISENKISELNNNDDGKTASSDFEPKIKDKNRNDKMLDYYRYFAPTAYPMPYVPYYNPYYQQPYMSAFYSPYYSGSMIDPAMQSADEYDEEYSDANDIDSENDDGSRANNKRRPGASKNSPIFYIRLPPTPYMFVPGMGYISQPPTIQPLTPQYPINPFINLPITYLSNAKPTGVFPWNQQPSANFGAPQFPSYLPPRPQKPYRPKPQLTPGPDSKITHLGSYLFNGRPESIYLMPPYNPYASPYHLPNPYQAAAPLPPTPYNPYAPIYAPQPALPSYY